MARLDSKVAIITGATGGIGEATAQLFLSEGAKVMLVGRSAEKLSASLERVGHEDSVRHFVADATDEAATKDAVAATVEAFGGVDILFANAGTEGVAKPLEDLTFEEFNHVLQTNVIGVWLSVKHCVADAGAGRWFDHGHVFGRRGHRIPKHIALHFQQTRGVRLRQNGSARAGRIGDSG